MGTKKILINSKEISYDAGDVAEAIVDLNVAGDYIDVSLNDALTWATVGEGDTAMHFADVCYRGIAAEREALLFVYNVLLILRKGVVSEVDLPAPSTFDPSTLERKVYTTVTTDIENINTAEAVLGRLLCGDRRSIIAPNELAKLADTVSPQRLRDSIHCKSPDTLNDMDHYNLRICLRAIISGRSEYEYRYQNSRDLRECDTLSALWKF